MDKRLFLILLMLSLPFCGRAEVTLPHLFGDNMVLQRNTEVALWGTASPGSELSVVPSWAAFARRTTADGDGNWQMRLPTPDAGGPYEIRISDGETVLNLRNVLIGEVWLCCGQSNMHIPIRGYQAQPTEGSLETILDADPALPIRILSVPKKVALTELKDCGGEWKEPTPEVVSSTSAIAYHFAVRLQASLRVPVGIVVSCQPGSTLDSWLSREAILDLFPDYDISHLEGAPCKDKPKRACCVFNALVAPLVPFTFKGWLFYQGESDRSAPGKPRNGHYARMFQAYAAMMRQLWGNDEWPLYYAQIAPYGGDDPDGIDGPLIQEAQAECQDLIPHSTMITTLDAGDRWNIHPRDKKTVALRFAAAVLSKEYGMGGYEVMPPRFKSVEFKDGKVVITFDRNKSGIAPRDHPVYGIEVAGKDKVFHLAEARIPHNGTCVEVTVPKSVKNPVAVRYCFHNWAEGNLTNDWGIPLSPFRSDNG